MGSDTPPIDLLLKCIEEEKNLSSIGSLVFIGSSSLAKIAKKAKSKFIVAKDIIRIDENPLLALRLKKDSSIAKGIDLLKKNEVDAFISAGHTGALMSLAKLNLPMLPKISRPALLALIPTEKKTIAVIDVGANISSKAKYLKENALLGAAFKKVIGNKKPILALLNIGSEEKKGTGELKKVYTELESISRTTNRFIFAGNIEPKEVFISDIDVLITDGFTGNIFLKTAEGMVNFLLDYLALKNEKDFESSFSNLKNYLHQEQYPGALLCGIDKIVIKCHSYSSIPTFIRAIKGSIGFIEKKIIHKLKKELLSLN